MNRFNSGVHEVLAVTASAVVLGYGLQMTADSGSKFYSKLSVKIILTVFSYVTVYLLFRRVWKTWQFPKLLLVLIAVLGTTLNLALISTMEGYQTYEASILTPSWDSNSFILSRIKEFALRILVLMPIESAAFFAMTFAFFFALKAVSLLFGSRDGVEILE